MEPKYRLSSIYGALMTLQESKGKAVSVAAAVKDVTRPPHGLDSRVWDDEEKMHAEVREALLAVAKDVWEGLGDDEGAAQLVDVVLTGSTTGERWSPLGDLDVHLVVRYDSDESMAADYFKARGRAWNTQHDIKIAGHPVEVYVQDESEPHYAAGVYSLAGDEWVQRQDPGEWAPYPDVSKKARALAQEIRQAVRNMRRAETVWDLSGADGLLKKLRDMRSAGLQRDGEGSVENLSYKALRRAGLIDRLMTARAGAFDRILMRDASSA